MKSLITSAVVFLGFAAMAPANPIAMDITSAVLTYTGPIMPRGEDVTLRGTAREIHAQILERNPNFNPDDFEVVRAAKSRAAKRELESRTRAGIACRIQTPGYYYSAQTWHIQEGIGYLNTLPGACGVGGHESTRLSCSYNAAIYMVNNNNGYTAAQCQYLANLAQDIVNTCGTNTDGGWVNGQESDSAGYVIIACGDTC